MTQEELQMAIQKAVEAEVARKASEGAATAEKVLPWVKGLVVGAFMLGVWLTGVTNQINNMGADVMRHEAELKVLTSDGQVVKQDLAVMKEILIRVDKQLEKLGATK